MRDRTATVESANLICASIMSKKLAEGLDGLVLDVKTGSGSFLQEEAASLRLASLMVQIGEASGTRTIALVTGMDEPLGRAAGNWIEIAEAVALLRGETDPLTEDLRSLSLSLAGWMIYLGGKSETAESGRHGETVARKRRGLPSLSWRWCMRREVTLMSLKNLQASTSPARKEILLPSTVAFSRLWTARK